MSATLDRRSFLAAMGTYLLGPEPERASQSTPPAADFTLHIGQVSREIAPKRIVKTTGYNGAFPGPVLRLPEGKPVTVDVYNDTSIPELVHWHGLFVPSEVDGSAEEGTPSVQAHGYRRYQFVPRPAGTRWYHTHISAGRDLRRATYTGQFGFLQVLSKEDPGRYDQEVLLALHGWDPYLLTQGGGGEGNESSLEVSYGAFTINTHALGGGEPIRVKNGQRVLLRILNASASSIHRLALPGHQFLVTALDGNPAPTPRAVNVLELAPAERIDAIIEMNQPGVWVLGEVDEKMRKAGMGIVVEYDGRNGPPQWSAPPKELWDYTIFGHEAAVAEPDERVPLVFKHKWAGNRWVDHWTINGKEFPKTDPIPVETGGRYRLIFDNQSDDTHPVHLHRHSFELVKVAGKPTAGVVKDVVSVAPHTQVEAQFVADNPGLSLFHCHMQLHMDFGFMALVEYAGYKAPAPE
jgi:FtsP/CotA-like multicopper oxidase with cupredoxin domain